MPLPPVRMRVRLHPQALSSFDELTFRRHLPHFFPSLARLVKCGYAPADVQRALSDLLLYRVGPLLDARTRTGDGSGLGLGPNGGVAAVRG